MRPVWDFILPAELTYCPFNLSPDLGSIMGCHTSSEMSLPKSQYLYSKPSAHAFLRHRPETVDLGWPSFSAASVAEAYLVHFWDPICLTMTSLPCLFELRCEALAWNFSMFWECVTHSKLMSWLLLQFRSMWFTSHVASSGGGPPWAYRTNLCTQNTWPAIATFR